MWNPFEVVAKPKLQCDLVLKRFLGRLLSEIYRATEPTDINDFYYNAKIKLSRSTINEMELFMNGEDNWTPEALDEALSGILVEVTPAVTSFDDMFLPLLIIGSVSIVVLIMLLIVLWLGVSWLKCFITTFAISFFVSIPWNWLYLYKEAYAKHQSKIMKVEIIHQECMRLQNLSWFDSLLEWFRTTWTFQRDPCEEYRKILLIDPFLEVPPFKAFMYTLTTFIIEPLKALGEGIGGFFRALLKDLPLLTWTLVLIIITIFILVKVVLMGGLLVVFHQQPRRFLPWLYRNQGRNVNTQAPNQLQNDNVRLEQIVIHQSQPNGTKGEINIQFLRSAGRPHIEEVPDVEGRQGSTDERNNISVKYSFEDQQKIQEEVRFSSVTPTDQAKGNQPKLDYSQAKNKKVKAEKEGSHDEPCGDATAPAPRAYRRKGFSIPKIHTENVSAQKI